MRRHLLKPQEGRCLYPQQRCLGDEYGSACDVVDAASPIKKYYMTQSYFNRVGVKDGHLKSTENLITNLCAEPSKMANKRLSTNV